MQKLNKLIEILLFSFVLIVYLFSASTTINFWDSPEFIASNFTLQASHAPGSPLYTMICSFILWFFPKYLTAYITNAISCFFGAVTVLFVYKIAREISLTILSKEKIKHTNNNVISIYVGLIASLTLAFSNSFWTASIEAEVYTLSFALLTIIIFVMILWYNTKNIIKGNKLLLLIGFLLGLAVSTHTILLTVIIPLTALVLHKNKSVTIKSISISFILGVILFLILYALVFKQIISISSKIDIYLVNELNFNVNIGSLLFILLIFITLIFSTFISLKKNKHHFYKASLFITFFLLGTSCYFMPLIRSDVNTLISEKVNTTNRLNNYLNASRFGIDKIPLLYGPSYNAQLDESRPFLNSKPSYIYNSETKKYEQTHDGFSKEVNYSFKFKSLFPRMYDANNEENYKAWTKIEGKKLSHKVKNEIKTYQVPTLGENISFFFSYQLYWLNIRYLFWNFVGKQNDFHGLGYIKNGNWSSGFNFIDKYHIGDYSNIQDGVYKTNKGSNHYYFIPLILGLIGLFSLRKHKSFFIYTLLIFLTFSIGITLYINPLPSSILVRERDYIFIGSYIIFSIWIGLSILSFLKFIKNPKIFVSISAFILLICPLQLLAKEWDDHQFNEDNFAYKFGKSYLDSCPKNAILITNGDNMTFPLLYLQEVENYRTDVRVLNYDQLNIDSQIENIKLNKYDSKKIIFSLKNSLYNEGVEKLLPFKKETEDPINLNILSNFLNSEKTFTEWNNRPRKYIPGNIFETQIDTVYFRKKNQLSYNLEIIPKITWYYNKPFYGLNDIVLFNIISNNINKRPICFANNSKTDHLIGLSPFLVQEGMVSTLLPLKRKSNTENPKIINTSKSYQILVENCTFNFSNNDNYKRDESKTYAKNILRQQYYFLAQALIEENKIDKAKKTLDKCVQIFPNHSIQNKQYTFALGKLYFRLGYNEQGNRLCTTSMQNILNEIKWMISFNPPNSIINVRHANKLFNMYKQMLDQYSKYNKNESVKLYNTLNPIAKDFNTWKTVNWPY